MTRSIFTHLLAAAAGAGLLLLAQFALRAAGESAPAASGIPAAPASAVPSRPSAPAAQPQKLALSLSEQETYTVTRVVDGDTLVLANGLHVRYRGVDTPEVGRYLIDPAPLAVDATERNRALVEGKRVRLALGSTPVDAYGRVVARVWVVEDGGGEGKKMTDVEEFLVREGLGKAVKFDRDAADYEALKAVESEAREKKAGLWGLERPAPGELPQEWRYCASAGGDVFHRPGCSHVTRTGAKSLVGYASLEEAVATGRRMCTLCAKHEAAKPPAQ
ncbi:MAG: thermonuclease family protein [Planctomycetes bacterium]|nr:thermonuclease family protein [Planctomycetota bacterium]